MTQLLAAYHPRHPRLPDAPAARRGMDAYQAIQQTLHGQTATYPG